MLSSGVRTGSIKWRSTFFVLLFSIIYNLKFSVTAIDKINEINFLFTDNEFSIAIESAYIISSFSLSESEKKILKDDLDCLLNKNGRWLIFNTFVGGIIFLREPETINKIDIRFSSLNNEANAIVEYASENRNINNIKYKPNTGQIESVMWSMLSIFPNFNKHGKETMIILMAIIGKMIKDICERNKKSSWCMNYDQPFDLSLFLDDQLTHIYKINID